jgi:ribosome-binding ATPase YchF (GTP1/OBG family)
MKNLLTKLLIILSLAVGLIFAYNRHIDSVRSEVAAELSQEYNRNLIVLQNKVDSKSEELVAKIKEIEYDKNLEINSLSANYESIIDGLRKRASRPTSKSNLNSGTGNSESKTGAYPAELFAEDAKAFIDFARDTEELRLNLIQCYKQYDEVKDAANSLSTIK